MTEEKPAPRSFTVGWTARVAAAGVLLSMVALAAPAYSAGGLEDDQAVILGSDGRIYSLNLTTAVATAGTLVSGVGTPLSPFSGLEADPTSDTLWALSGSAVASLTAINAVTGVPTVIKDDYGAVAGAILEGIARTDSGVFYLSHYPQGIFRSSISRVDPTSGVLSATQPFTFSGAYTSVTALAAVGDTLYAFASRGEDRLYGVDPATGFLTLLREKSVGFGDTVAAADSTSSGRIYFISLDGDMISTLHFLEVSGGSTTTVGPILGMGTTTAENLAIATLLSSERISPERDEGDTREDDNDEEEQIMPTVLITPSLAATGAELDWLLVTGVIVAVLGVFLIIVSAAARRSRAGHSALEANERRQGAPRR